MSRQPEGQAAILVLGYLGHCVNFGKLGQNTPNHKQGHTRVKLYLFLGYLGH